MKSLDLGLRTHVFQRSSLRSLDEKVFLSRLDKSFSVLERILDGFPKNTQKGRRSANIESPIEIEENGIRGKRCLAIPKGVMIHVQGGESSQGRRRKIVERIFRASPNANSDLHYLGGSISLREGEVSDQRLRVVSLITLLRFFCDGGSNYCQRREQQTLYR